jgi:hypothetical protein
VVREPQSTDCDATPERGDYSYRGGGMELRSALRADPRSSRGSLLGRLRGHQLRRSARTHESFRTPVFKTERGCPAESS